MKFLTTKALLLFSLTLAWTLVTPLASADSPFEQRGNRPLTGTSSWQLGTFQGGLRGYEILYRAPGHKRWERAPGAAVAISDGWVLGTDRHVGGYGIYRWNGYDWNRMPGAAVQIGGSYRNPWVVNDRGIRYDWNGYNWYQTVQVSRNNRISSRGWEPGRNEASNNFHNQNRDSRGSRGNDTSSNYKPDRREEDSRQNSRRADQR